ncbi:anion permease [Enterobacter ludwigii]
MLAFYLLHYLFASTTAHTTALLPAMLTIASYHSGHEYGGVRPADGDLPGCHGDYHPLRYRP